MAEFPSTGDQPYGPKLKTYVDAGDAAALAAATTAEGKANDALYAAGQAGANAIPRTADIANIVKITAAAYAALAVKQATTLYVIVG